MRKMLKIGIAGFRHNHIYSLINAAKKSERAECVAFWEEFPADIKIAERDYGITVTHKTYEEMLSDPEIDAIGIGNYYGARGKMAIEALKAGKHVIADKPLCTSLSELEEIKRLSKEKGLKVGLMLDLRHNKNVLAAKKLIDEGKIGEIHNIQFGGQHPLLYGYRPAWYFEEGKHGGVINDIGIHGIDLVSYFTGSKITDILGARCWNAYAKEEPSFKDSGQFMLTLKNGAGVIADISYSVPNSIGYGIPYYWEFKIWGSKGVIGFCVSKDGVKLYANGEKTATDVEPFETEDNYLEAFIDEIEGKKSELLSMEDVFDSTEATLLIQKKADEAL